MYETIVVPLDGSALAEGALRPGAGLARRLNAELVLLHVASPGHSLLSEEEYLERCATLVEAPKVTPEIVEADDPADAIVNAVSGDALLVMGTYGRSGAAYLTVGSTAEAVLRSVGRPVLLVGPNGGGARWELDRDDFESILLCIDGSETSKQAVPVAVDWVRGLGARLVMIQVLPPGAMASGDVFETNELARIARHLEAEGVESLEWDVLHDKDPATAILQFAGEHEPSVIVMATHGRSGLSRVVLGSVSMRVVHEAHSPVLVVRPTN